jgi:hypothetical protein
LFERSNDVSLVCLSAIIDDYEFLIAERARIKTQQQWKSKWEAAQVKGQIRAFRFYFQRI